MIPEDTTPPAGLHTIQHSEVAVFPNPVADLLNVRSTNDNEIEYLELRDVNGRPVKQVAAINRKTAQLNIGDLPHGNYFLFVAKSGGEYLTKKIVH